MRVAIVGTGYVGLVSGACFSDFGHNVICVDKDQKKISALRGGRIPIFEPGLDELVRRNSDQGRIQFTTELASAVASADAVFIAVGTPSRRGDGYADLSYVYSSAKEIGQALKNGAVVVTKSTVPVGTGDEVERIIRDMRPSLQFSVVSNPEFLREGAAINDFKHPDRIVVGCEDSRARHLMQEIYRPLLLDEAQLLITTRRTAELIKYASNAFLATKITFINEVSDLCEKVGTDVQDVARGIGLDRRIGGLFLHAGPGYGGSCFPKDTTALIKTAHDFGASLRVVEAVVSVNDRRKRDMARKVVQACNGVRGKTIGVLGLTFKPDTDDLRESPAISVIVGLQDAGAIVKAYDPAGMEHASLILSDVKFVEDAYACATDSHALVIATEWEEFRALDLERIRAELANPTVVDLRNIYRSEDMIQRGFSYHSIGRPSHSPVLSAPKDETGAS